MMRMSTLTGLVPPTRSISRSWMARSSLACRRASISLISSSSSVPPLASSNLPMRRATAPVNAPFSWPNNSDSRRFSGIAAQLTEMNGLSARVRFAVDVAGQHFLTGAAFAGDEDRGLAAGDLVGERQHRRHRFVFVDQLMAFVGHRCQHGRDQFGIGRAGADIPWRRRGSRRRRGACRCRRRRPRPACRCARPPAPRTRRADVERHIRHHEVGAAPAAQARPGPGRCRPRG